MEPIPGDDETLDAFYFGRIKILQKKHGYRFSVDAPLLADFIQTRSQDRLLELGTGSGVISLLLSLKAFASITALEVQPSLADLALRNVRLNNLDAKIFVRQVDLKTFCSTDKFDVIFSNPPYHVKDTGHVSAVREKAVAKHELECDIFTIMRKTQELLHPQGRAYYIFPEKRRDDFCAALKASKLLIRKERSVVPRTGQAAKHFLTECGYSADKKVVLPPLILYDEEGNYSSEVQEIFRGRRHIVSDKKV